MVTRTILPTIGAFMAASLDRVSDWFMYQNEKDNDNGNIHKTTDAGEGRMRGRESRDSWGEKKLSLSWPGSSVPVIAQFLNAWSVSSKMLDPCEIETGWAGTT